MNREVVITYLEALIQATEKKKAIIEQLFALAKEQEELSRALEFDLDAFHKTMEEKGKWIEALSTIDNGFSQTFDRIKDVIMSDKEAYRKEIETLQRVIANVTKIAVELQVLEKRNKLAVDRRIAESRQKMKLERLDQQQSKISNN